MGLACFLLCRFNTLVKLILLHPNDYPAGVYPPRSFTNLTEHTLFVTHLLLRGVSVTLPKTINRRLPASVVTLIATLQLQADVEDQTQILPVLILYNLCQLVVVSSHTLYSHVLFFVTHLTHICMSKAAMLLLLKWNYSRRKLDAFLFLNQTECMKICAQIGALHCAVQKYAVELQLCVAVKAALLHL